MKYIQFLARVPHWTNWIAQDFDGEWYAFQHAPIRGRNCWMPDDTTRISKLSFLFKENRPNNKWKGTVSRVWPDGTTDISGFVTLGR